MSRTPTKSWMSTTRAPGGTRPRASPSTNTASVRGVDAAWPCKHAAVDGGPATAAAVLALLCAQAVCAEAVAVWDGVHAAGTYRCFFPCISTRGFQFMCWFLCPSRSLWQPSCGVLSNHDQAHGQILETGKAHSAHRAPGCNAPNQPPSGCLPTTHRLPQHCTPARLHPDACHMCKCVGCAIESASRRPWLSRRSARMAVSINVQSDVQTKLQPSLMHVAFTCSSMGTPPGALVLSGVAVTAQLVTAIAPTRPTPPHQARTTAAHVRSPPAASAAPRYHSATARTRCRCHSQ